MIRDVTGLNEARDGSMPDRDALVGIQKMAANASNTATNHIRQAGLFLTLRVCENVSLRIADCLDFPLTAKALEESISSYNVSTLREISKLNLHSFGIFLELEPDDEEKAILEQNIQIALQSGGIDLDDAIDIRQVKNLKLANQMLKFRKTKKRETDQAAQMANIQAQAQANQQTAEKAALFEVQKQQALTQETVNIEQAKSKFAIEKMQIEAQLKQGLMKQEFDYNMQLTTAKARSTVDSQTYSEEKKDSRVRLQGTIQSQNADQKANNKLPQDFESSGFDGMGGFGLEQFEPK